MKVTINAMTFEGAPEEIDAVVKKYGPGRLAAPKEPPLNYEEMRGYTAPRDALPHVCDHVYPLVWHGIIPPPCQRCGQ